MGKLLSKIAARVGRRAEALIGVFALSLLASPRAWAIRQPASDEALRIAVDTSTLADADRERIRKFVLSGLVVEVEGKGIEVVVDGAATTLRVRIEYLDREDLEFAVYYDIQRAGVIHSDVPWVACMFCVDAQLLQAVNGGLPKALERIDELDEPIESIVPATVEEPNVGHVTAIGPIGIVGTLLAGSGLGLAITGASELARGQELLGVGEQQQRFLDHQQSGQILLVAGASALVFGIAMLAVDLEVRTAKRKNIDESTRVLAPALGRGFAGLSYGQRF